MGRRGLQRFATNDWQVAYKNTGNLQTEREACLLFNRSAGCLAQSSLATRTINFIQSLPTTEGNPAKLMGWQQRFIRDLLKANKDKRCVLGLDMSSSVDLTALDATVVGADLTYATALSMASTADQANIC